MKIIVNHWERESDYDGGRQTMFVDGKKRLYVGPLSECPEDAIIGRSLVDCNQVADFMKEAYEAGKRGEEFTLESKEGDPED